MDKKEILKFCFENGLLLDKEVLNLFTEIGDLASIKLILEKVKTHANQKIITKSFFFENKNQISKYFLEVPGENREEIQKLKIKLGLNIEISKEINTNLKTSLEDFKNELMNPLKKDQEFVVDNSKTNPSINKDVKILSNFSFLNNKPEVKDFVKYFRNRFLEMKKTLQEHVGLNNLVSINKISGSKQNISLIGLVSDKRVTKNKNIIFEIEDLTGKIKVLINSTKKELYQKADDIALDSVIGFNGSGNREILFVNDVFFPDSTLIEKKNSPYEEIALFIGDLHFGSKRFLEEGFLKFINYLNGNVPNTPEANKIKYLFIVGDLITGIGNYPDQERDLKIKDLEEQFSGLANLLSKIRKDILLIISPGNHDGVRLMEPQPTLDEKYAWPLYDLKNAIFTTNPCSLNIGAKSNFSGFDVLTYHGFSFPFYANSVPSLMTKKTMNTPEEIMKYLLKHRHLAPTHSSVQYFPHDEDPLIIKKTPDIFVSGHTHKSAVSYYNNILLVSISSWERLTPYQEKFGNEPDHCKVPMFNLKTRVVKILDFE